MTAKDNCGAHRWKTVLHPRESRQSGVADSRRVFEIVPERLREVPPRNYLRRHPARDVLPSPSYRGCVEIHPCLPLLGNEEARAYQRLCTHAHTNAVCKNGSFEIFVRYILVKHTAAQTKEHPSAKRDFRRNRITICLRLLTLSSSLSPKHRLLFPVHVVKPS